MSLALQGRSDGGIWVFIPPKSAQVNFLWGKMTSERLFNSRLFNGYSTPPPKKNFYTPENKFLATPLLHCNKAMAFQCCCSHQP